MPIISSLIWRKLMGGAVQLPRTRQAQLKKTFHNFVLTVVCGFTTVLVLKGSTTSTGFDHHEYAGALAVEDPAPSTNFFTNHHRNPLITKLDKYPHAHFLTNRNRPHKSQNPHSQIPPFPTANLHDQASNSELPNIARSDQLQHSRLLSEAHDVIQSLPHALSTKRAIKDQLLPSDNPVPTLNQLISTNPNSNIHLSNTNQVIEAGSSDQYPNQIGATSMDKIPYQIITKASAENQNHYKSDEFDLNLPESAAAGNRRARPQPHLATHYYQPSILLVTGSQPFACANPMGDYYLMKSLKNKMDYCRLHDLDIFYNMANLDPQMSGFWAKLPLIYTLMQAHPETEWLWWMDSDAMITDMAFELPMDRYKDYNLVLHGWKELVYDQKNWVGLNTGSFLIRNCDWSLNLIEEWAPMGPKGKVREEAGHLLSKALKGRPDFEADDQSALIYLLNEQKAKWASKVYLENAYNLHGYWSIIVERYEEMMERYHSGLGDHERWPFVTHFVGCKPCTNINNRHLAALDQAKCLEHMERAFNFADNQVLQIYGFQHEALNTHRVFRS